MARRVPTRAPAVPRDEAGRIVAQLVAQLMPCGAGSTRDVRLSPGRVCTSASRVGRPITVCMERHAPLPGESGTSTEAVYDYDVGLITVRRYAAPTQCFTPATLAQTLRPIVQHELRHVTDPGVHRSGAQVPMAHRAYVNDAAEVTAFLAEVAAELTTARVRRNVMHRAANMPINRVGLLMQSRTYTRLAPYLTARNRRRFLRLAADLWASGQYGPTPLRGLVRPRTW